MTDASALRTAIVLRVSEESCELADGSGPVRFASIFPRPRAERVLPGHLVAIWTDLVLWRWYDAVVLGHEGELTRLWEPAHGEVLARSRGVRHAPGTRAYLSAGLPDADWWVAGPVTSTQDVELAEVAGLYTENDLWGSLG